MTKTIRTNPAYAHLAYRKAILQHTINYLMDDYVGRDGESPKGTIFCDEVFKEDSEIPSEDIYEIVEDLRIEVANVELELSMFEFTRRGDDKLFSKKPEKNKQEDQHKASGSAGPKPGKPPGNEGGRSGGGPSKSN